jgi:hypothetical protein
MRIAFHLCLLAACSAMSSELALAASHGHRPSTAAVRSAPAGGDTGKSTVTQTEPAQTTPPPAGGNAGDAPIDTSITVNQGHHPLTGKEAAAKKLTAEPGKLIPGQAKPHPPAHPFLAHAVARRNAVGAVATRVMPRAGNHAAVAAGASAPATPAGRSGAAAMAPATPAPHDVSGTAATAPKSPAAIAADHSAAALKAATTNGPSINGTGIRRSDTTTGAVGGPAKAVAAAVSGSSFRPKHP